MAKSYREEREIEVSSIWFRWGSMNSGKSTALLQVAYNYEERGQNVLVLKPSVDTKDDQVVSRLGAKRKVDIHVTPDYEILKEVKKILKEKKALGEKIACLLIDEAQFLKREQVNDLFTIAVTLNVPVIAYGIRNDFQTNAFEGSARLLEIAHKLEEMKTICRCGRKAILNGRKINGEFVREGSQVAIDGQHAEYESLCGACYIRDVGSIK
jgi:thymidine kinase